MNKLSKIKSIILPYKSINIFIISVLFIGIITGSIYASTIGLNDKNLVIEKINIFINNINTNSLNRLLVLKNSLGINLTYTFLIWILGMSIIGIIFCILLLFIKSFIIGFSISSFIITFKIKGILLSLIYLLFGQILNILTIIVLSIYSIMFTIKLLSIIFKNNNNLKIRKFIKNYLIILIICILTNIISSLSETFILPAILKLAIKLFI